jgi:LysM repeat protein
MKETKGNILTKIHRKFGVPTNHIKEGENLVVEGRNNQ